MHNVSVMLQDEEGWIDDAGYRSTYLNIFDRKWSDETNLHLSDFIETRVAEYSDDEAKPNA